ncbi:hypothetical protein WJX72_010337 [[Myrmecia] bisecta]|uniref:Integral membrane bound transporter domain-containing protein n=1 Tax=[Myrmecia] bisecta TaxID=41462 RepID=A0AAW1Q899_9CHLO
MKLPPIAQLPDCVKGGIRLAVPVGGACLLGLSMRGRLGGIETELGNSFSLACQWAAVSMAIISSPVTGTAAKVGLERVLGTLIGGWLGAALWKISSNAVFLGCAGLVIAFTSYILGAKLKLQYGVGKLLVLTYLIVIYAAAANPILWVALSRTTGICCGVVAYLVAAIFLFPTTGSQLALDSLNAALEATVLTSLSKYKQHMEEAKTENRLGIWRGRWSWYVPALPCHGSSKRSHMPKKQLNEVEAAIRKVIRTLWALRLAIVEGFDDSITATLQQRYPYGMLQELRDASLAALQDACTAFVVAGPVQHWLKPESLDRFDAVASRFLLISALQRNLMAAPFFPVPTPAAAGEPSADPVAVGGDAASQQREDRVQARSQALAAQRDLLAVAAGYFFPPSDAGYFAKVRWYSFQFVIAQLADDLRRLFEAINAVLPKLPASQLRAQHQEVPVSKSSFIRRFHGLNARGLNHG